MVGSVKLMVILVVVWIITSRPVTNTGRKPNTAGPSHSSAMTGGTNVIHEEAPAVGGMPLKKRTRFFIKRADRRVK